MKFILLAIFVLLSPVFFAEGKQLTVYYVDSCNTVISTELIEVSETSFSDHKPNPIFKLFRKKQRLNKRITAAVLAFPFPFGIVGLHRIYLGTKPYVPVAYIASIGGAFGILPFIDFCAITFDKKFDVYKNNGQIFMWLNH